MTKKHFNETVKSSRFTNAGAVCKEYYTPIDRWVLVKDSLNDNSSELFGILKPDPKNPSVLDDALKQIIDAIEPLGGRLVFTGHQFEIGPISNDPGIRRPFLILDADPTAVINALAEINWKNNPYSDNPHTIIEDVLNKKRLMPAQPTTPEAPTVNHDPI